MPIMYKLASYGQRKINKICVYSGSLGVFVLCVDKFYKADYWYDNIHDSGIWNNRICAFMEEIQ